MKLFFLILTLAFSTGCKENQDETIKKENPTFKDVSKDFVQIPGIAITHKIAIQCGEESLPVRKRVLSAAELVLSNSGSPDGQKLNDSLIIAYLYNDTEIELIEESDDYYKIKFNFKNEIKEGFIIKLFCGHSSIAQSFNSLKWFRDPNFIVNPGLLPYCRVFVSERFYDLLSFGKNSKDPLKHFLETVQQTQTEPIIFSIFVGESKRELYNNTFWIGSDMSPLLHCVQNAYYTYELSNYTNMFIVTSPALPKKIITDSISNDTLRIVTRNNDPELNEEKILLYPIDQKRAFTNRSGGKWVLNDTLKLIDISYLSDNIKIPETQIGHQYFYEVLERFIQEVLPKRRDTYLEHYLDNEFPKTTPDSSLQQGDDR